MGGCLTTEERVQPISHTELDSSSNSSKEGKLNNEFSGPVKTQTRSCTDVFFLVLMGIFFIGLLAVVGYCVKNGEIYRIINGYDNCGNICGKNNYRLPEKELACHGVDMTDKKFVLIKEASKALIDPKHVRRECVENCTAYPNYVTLLNRCIPNATGESVKSFFSKTGIQNFFHEVSEDLHLCWPEILYLCLIAFGISAILLVLLRYTAGILVWFVLAGVVVTSITGTIYLWLKWHARSSGSENVGEIEDRKENTYFVYAIVSTIITVIILLIVLVMRKRIQLVVKLFEEAGKAVNSMPLLLCQPIMTFAVLAVVVTMWFMFELWIESSGYLRPVPNSENLYYKKDITMKAARWYNLFAMFWFTQFVIGCQHMIIAGAVATWFFTRNKSNVDSPISTSFGNMVKWHLGSIALGSLLIALIQFARVVLKAVQAQVKGKDTDFARCLFRACQCCLYCFEKCLSYITRNAFIEIAIYGENFCRSGQQAFKMLTNNVLRVAAINSVGDFVLFLGKVFVVATTVLIGTKMLENKEGVQHVWVPLVFAGLFAFLVSHCFITVYEMVIDTIFLCFCEDCEMNDGISKPYFMSRGLMEFVENSKKVLSVGDGADGRNNAWSASTGRPNST